VDYLSNCVALQSYLIDEVKRRRQEKGVTTQATPPTLTEEEEVLKDIKGEDGVPKYSVPTFERKLDLGADIHDVTFELTDDMVNSGTTAVEKSQPKKEAKHLRLLLVKPLFGMAQSGQVAREVLKHYKIQDVSKKLIVVVDDMTSLPGSIQIKEPSDTKLIGHSGIDSIAVHVGTPKFTR
jgi:phosphoribosylpyrophosphate synthetase